MKTAEFFEKRRNYYYPSWFLEPPASESVATGYGRSRNDAEDEITEALLDACANLCRQERTRVTGGRIGLRKGGGSGIILEGLDEEPVRANIDGFASRASILCSFRHGWGTILLASVAPMDVSCAKLVDIRSAEPPEWIKNLPLDDRFNYAVGVSAETYSDRAGWLAAEQDLRKELALQDSRISVLVKQKPAGEPSTISELAFDEPVILRGIVVTGRWKDPATGTRYVLGRMRR